jgi:hypothetical protein
MANSKLSPEHMLRSVLLPMDCSAEHIEQLLNLIGAGESPVSDRLEKYCVKALKRTVGPDDSPIISDFHEIATFTARAALRVESADPVTGTHHYEGFPDGSSERRMMTHLLQKHPGISKFTHYIQRQYVKNALYAFENLISDLMRKEVVSTLFVPDQDTLSPTHNTLNRTYVGEDRSIDDPCAHYIDDVTQCESGFKIPVANATPRTLIEPLHDTLSISRLECGNLPAIKIRNDRVFIPTEVVLVRLANYAFHAWYRLVHLAYSMFPEEYTLALISQTPAVDDRILHELKFGGLSRSFNPHYGTDTDNPLVDPTFSDRITRPDKRLVTVADTIRNSPTLKFDTTIYVQDLFEAVCAFFPAPNRPGNDVTDKATLRDALNAARDSRIQFDDKSYICSIPSPKPSPFLPSTNKSLWDQYQQNLNRLPQQSINVPDTRNISPILPESLWPTQSKQYQTALEHMEQVAVTEPRYDAKCVNKVPRLNDHTGNADLEWLTAGERLFLTRVGLAMERRIEEYSLTESMAGFNNDPSGTNLDVDIDALIENGYLSKPKSPRTYYSVPWSVRKPLGIPNISHDGWGERSPSENTLHRVGVDLLAFLVATRPDVDTVVRYCDLWRLQPTEWWDAISHLGSKRMDVVGFSQNAPVVVGEVETKTGNTAGTQDTISKLDAFPETLDRFLVAPSGKHLPALLSRLSKFDQYSVSASERSGDGYRPADARSALSDEGVIETVFDDLLTYRSIRRALPDTFDPSDYADSIVGGI